MERPPGKPADLDAAYERHSMQLYAYCMSILRHRDDAEDAVQETFARAAAQRDRLEGELLPFLTTVARNISIDMIRQRRHRGPEIGEEHPDGSRGPEPRAVDRHMLEETWRMLSQRDRLLLAHSFAGFAYDEISRRTGLSPKSVSVGICRAREHSRTAAAAVASLLVPAVLRRLLDRARSAVSSPQAAGAALTGLEQGGLLAASMLVALVGTSSGTPSLHQPHAAPTLTGVALSRAATVAAAGTTTPPRPSGGVRAPASPTGPATPLLPHVASSDQSAPVFAELPGHRATQQDTQVYSMTASPSYPRDHTVYAAGAVFTGCLAMNACPALFRSEDGGGTWSMLPAAGYEGGSVILPSSYPADPTIFVAGQAGLQRSDDGGASFVSVVPYPAPAAVVPGLPASDTQVVVASSPIAIYLARQHTVVPGPALPAGVVADDIAFSDTSHMVVTGHRFAPSLEGVVAVCESGGSCREVFDVPGEVLRVATTPLAAGQDLTVVWSAQRVYVSRDGAASFSAAKLPPGELVSAASFGGGLIAVATYDHDASQALHSQLLTSPDGLAFQPVALTPSRTVQLDALLPLADRMLVGLATPDPQEQVGLRCSTDGARSWRSSC
jgi:RNA polymerase sigma-70 factor (ECF subfamily)